MSIETRFDISFVAEMALREKQIQQNYRPVIAVHKWFARRPGTLFRSLILSEFGGGALRDSYFAGKDLHGVQVADPFMGGGIPLLEANRLGCDVLGFDINPMAYWIVRQEIGYLDVTAYQNAARGFLVLLDGKIGDLYRTECQLCGSANARVKYWVWVKTVTCGHCGKLVDLFPSYLLAEDKRHPLNVLVCGQCGELNEAQDRLRPGRCRSCDTTLRVTGPARNNRCKCPSCGATSTYPDCRNGPPRHRMFAIEYFCPKCRPSHSGRFFKKPSHADLAIYEVAKERWATTEPMFVPDDEIPAGDETDRLHRWGYRHYSEMFNDRQLLGLELSCRLIVEVSDQKLRAALATNLSDLLRYQNMLCRYDAMALKSLDIFSIHGFPVGLVQCESNMLGIADETRGTNVGSGGWSNMVDKYAKAKAYCMKPFEIRQRGRAKEFVCVPREWIGDIRCKDGDHSRRVDLRCESATSALVEPQSLDAVFTDPPYFGNVQYAELMDFCYVWLRRLVGSQDRAFCGKSTRNANELTANVAMERGLAEFAEGLSRAIRNMAVALKPGSALAFTYHHNRLDAYYPVAVAVLDASLACSASLPCPAEMGASIHINGTSSSIIDTIFVCRSTGRVPRRWIASGASELAGLVRADVDRLHAGAVKVTKGDVRCVIFGHLIRMAIWRLRPVWDLSADIGEKLAAVASDVAAAGGLQAVEDELKDMLPLLPCQQSWSTRESYGAYEVDIDEVPF